MVDATPFLPGLSPVQGKAVVARFDGGRLSSEGGMLALREIERRLGLADRLAGCLRDPRMPEKVVHRLAQIIRFRMLMIAAGYEDGNDADTLRADPMFKLALDRLPSGEELCSQSTISRLENLPDLRALLRLGRALVEQYCSSFRAVPKRIVLDIDDTFDRVHGGQQLRLFNAYHDDYGFQPIVVFDGEERWSRVESIIARVEAGSEGTDTRFIVPNLGGGRAQHLYERLYFARGQAENHIKSWKNHLAADRTSCHTAEANQFRLFLHAGAYWLLWSMRRVMPKRSTWRVMQFDTLRLRLIRIAARVVELKTQLKIHLPSSAPDQAICTLLLARLPRLVT